MDLKKYSLRSITGKKQESVNQKKKGINDKLKLLLPALLGYRNDPAAVEPRQKRSACQSYEMETAKV